MPTLADLLAPPAQRPKLFLRKSDELDAARGGFVAPACTAGPAGCFNTQDRGNGNGGHAYGTDLPDADKSDLLAYLLTF